jgi:Sulfotransferase domain
MFSSLACVAQGHSVSPFSSFRYALLIKVPNLAMKIALEELGYKKVYHFFAVHKDPSHADLWIAALRRKYEPHLRNSTEDPETDWNQLLRGYNVNDQFMSGSILLTM